jgi:organic hydroperoxide reductase OsmC/OhrA
MKHTYTAKVSWKNDGGQFAEGKYSRAHKWKFDCGIEIDASASPQVVPLPYSRAEAVDPEEAFVAAVSSCHMLTFLYLASKEKINISSYTDNAVGVMEPNPNGKLWVSKVALRPDIVFDGNAPSAETIHRLHHDAHEECYIANSIKTEVTVEESWDVEKLKSGESEFRRGRRNQQARRRHPAGRHCAPQKRESTRPWGFEPQTF